MNQHQINRVKGLTVKLTSEIEEIQANVQCLQTFADILTEDQVVMILDRIGVQLIKIRHEVTGFTFEA